MSALDLFASALGAFILIAVAALPYYLNNAKIDKHFFVITIAWDNPYIQDIDLIVKDPQGNVFDYQHVAFPGSSGTLTVDSKQVSRGSEVWIDKNIDPEKVHNQKWEVYYKRFPSKVKKGNRVPVKVEGYLLTSIGTYEFPTHNMTSIKKLVPVATIVIDNNKLDVKIH